MSAAPFVIGIGLVMIGALIALAFLTFSKPTRVDTTTGSATVKTEQQAGKCNSYQC